MSTARVLFAAAALAAGCATQLPVAGEQDAARVGEPLESLQAGRQQYLDKCADCHELVAPGRFSASRWPALVDEMTTDVPLSARDRKLLLLYLQAFARQPEEI